MGINRTGLRFGRQALFTGLLSSVLVLTACFDEAQDKKGFSGPAVLAGTSRATQHTAESVEAPQPVAPVPASNPSFFEFPRPTASRVEAQTSTGTGKQSPLCELIPPKC